MIWKDVFPEYAVKQAFHEENLERSDEHIITAMQSDLLSRCLYSILKNALVHCTHKKRKFVSTEDIEIGKQLCIFPSKIKPAEAGSLLDSAYFQHIVHDHINLFTQQFLKQCSDVQINEYKLSAESYKKLQEEVEGCIRGFVNEMRNRSLNGTISFKQFESTMSKIIGDPTYIIYDQGYVKF
jgi:histone H3/H4